MEACAPARVTLIAVAAEAKMALSSALLPIIRAVAKAPPAERDA